MTFAEICTVLTREPFNLGFEEIGNLNDYQIFSILFAPDPFKKREEEKQQNSFPDYKSLFWDVWQKRGETEEKIQVRWEEYLREMKKHG